MYAELIVTTGVGDCALSLGQNLAQLISLPIRSIKIDLKEPMGGYFKTARDIQYVGEVAHVFLCLCSCCVLGPMILC